MGALSPVPPAPLADWPLSTDPFQDSERLPAKGPLLLTAQHRFFLGSFQSLTLPPQVDFVRETGGEERYEERDWGGGGRKRKRDECSVLLFSFFLASFLSASSFLTRSLFILYSVSLMSSWMRRALVSCTWSSRSFRYLEGVKGVGKVAVVQSGGGDGERVANRMMQVAI